MKYIMALDQGTTSSRSILFSEDGRLIAQDQVEFKQIYPRPGWVEHDPFDILSSQLTSMRRLIDKTDIAPSDIAAIGITNQRETAIIWDKNTGKPVYNAIVWQCRRTADICEGLKASPEGQMIYERTGLVIDAYFSATKIKWILDNVPGARERAERGELLFGTVDSWLIWNLTGHRSHVTDYTNASRTMAYNIYDLAWDDDILALLDIPKCIMPQVLPCTALFGALDSSFIGTEIPIHGVAGDQQAALFGQGCVRRGMAKNTYGTGGFLLMYTGEAVKSRNQLLTTIAWDIGGGVKYALEGSIFIAGAAVQWLRDELCLISSAAETEEIALSVPDSGGAVLVPAFTGLGAPYWDMYGRGILVGLTRGTGRAHIVRATLESIAYQTRDVLSAMEKDSGLALSHLQVDGGASANNFLIQFQADILGTSVSRPKITETTALGAAYLAGLGAGIWGSAEEVAGKREEDRLFTPAMDTARREQLYARWLRAVERSMGWAKE